MPEEEIPPDWMWLCDDEIKIWFNTINQNRKDKYGDHSDDDQADELEQNDLARAWREN